MRSAASLLVSSGREILSLVPKASPEAATPCPGWSLRDVAAHCSSAVKRAATGTLHRFGPDDNEADVDERRTWELGDVLLELEAHLEAAAVKVDAAEGTLDGLGIGMWVHVGDVRSALGIADAYASPGVELALPLIEERSRRLDHAVTVELPDATLRLGPTGEQPSGTLRVSVDDFVRIVAGRGEPADYDIDGVTPDDVLLFT